MSIYYIHPFDMYGDVCVYPHMYMYGDNLLRVPYLYGEEPIHEVFLGSGHCSSGRIGTP